jgi:hypothetical protein
MAAPHELPAPRHRRRLSIARFLAELVVGDPAISPWPPGMASRWPRGVGRSALCVVTGLSRDGDGLDRFPYVGSGLSWKPIAAAFRFSVSSILAFILASYSSIDWAT